MPKTRPRYDYLARRPDPAKLADPLPPLLIARLAETPELAAHRELVGHYKAATEKTTKLAAELETTKREDDERRLAALSKGRKPPAKRAAAVEASLEEARGDVDMLGGVVIASAEKLLVAAMPVLASVDEESSAAVEAALDETAGLIGATEGALDRAEQLSGQSGWLAQLRQTGSVAPWTGRPAHPAPNVRQLLRQASEALTFDRGRVSEQRERAERERAEALASLPPGAKVWAGGQTLVADGKGGLKEAER